MSEREDEMARAINERAQKMSGGEADKQGSAENGRSYADFKATQKNKIVSENPQNFAHTTKQQNPDPLQQNSEQQNYQPQGQKKQIITFAAYGGFWRRLAASFLDYWPTWIVAILVYGYVAFLLLQELGVDMYGEPGMEEILEFDVLFVIPIIVGLINIIYNAYLYFTKGETIGYRLLGMRIISQKTGQMHTSWPLTGRWALKTIMTIIPYLGMIGMLVIGGMVAWNDKKQGPHDMAAGTLVVMEKVRRTWLVWAVNLIPLIFISIGILAGILFVAIDPSVQIDKANDTVIKTQLAGFSTQATLFYINNDNSYENVCNSLILENDFICSSNDDSWAVIKMGSAPTNFRENSLCIDSTGQGVVEVEWDYNIFRNSSCISGIKETGDSSEDKNNQEVEEIFEG